MAGHCSNLLTWVDLWTEGRAAWVGQSVAFFDVVDLRKEARVAAATHHPDGTKTEMKQEGTGKGECGIFPDTIPYLTQLKYWIPYLTLI